MFKRFRTAAVLVVAVVLILALIASVGCSKKPEAPKSGGVPVPSTPPAELDDGEGLVRQLCSTCHSVDTVYAKKSSDAKEWQRTIRRMKEQYGATVSDEQATAMAEYLSKL